MQRCFAVLVGAMHVASACAGETVATQLARALQVDDNEHPGLRAGSGYWQLSAACDDLVSLAETPSVLDDELGSDSRVVQASEPVRPIGAYVGAGIIYRDSTQQFGVAIGVADLGAPYQVALTRSGFGVADRESVYEMSWRIEVTGGFALRSDVQYIRNPGMDATVDSSWTIGLRFELSAR